MFKFAKLFKLRQSEHVACPDGSVGLGKLHPARYKNIILNYSAIWVGITSYTDCICVTESKLLFEHDTEHGGVSSLFLAGCMILVKKNQKD